MLFEPGLNAHCSEFYYMNMANIFALSIYGNLNTTLSNWYRMFGASYAMAQLRLLAGLLMLNCNNNPPMGFE